jgi:hypothetical protein
MVYRLLRLWGSPPAPGEQALADFRALYADSLELNGSEVFVEELVFRARVLHSSTAEPAGAPIEVPDVAE